MSVLNRPAVLLLAALAPLGAAFAANPGGYTLEFPIAACEFSPQGGNAFFNLRANRQLYLSNQRCSVLRLRKKDSWNSGSQCSRKDR